MSSPDSLYSAIQDLHLAIAEHQDPQAKQILAGCLQSMLKVQAQDHANPQQGGGAQPPQQAQQSPDQGGGGLAALLQSLHGQG